MNFKKTHSYFSIVLLSAGLLFAAGAQTLFSSQAALVDNQSQLSSFCVNSSVQVSSDINSDAEFSFTKRIPFESAKNPISGVSSCSTSVQLIATVQPQAVPPNIQEEIFELFTPLFSSHLFVFQEPRPPQAA